MSKTWVHTHLPRLKGGEINMLSVKEPGEKIDYASWVSLRNVEFRVHERGRLRCVESGQRNVHAWVVGDRILVERDYQGQPPKGWHRAVYDPWKGDSFVDADTLLPVHQASMAIMNGKDVYYW